MYGLRRLPAALGLALAAGLAHADVPLLLTFDANTQSSFVNGVFESGFRFTNDQSLTVVWPNDGPPGGAANGTPTLMSYRYELTMRRPDGQAFTLQTLDIGLNWSSVPSYDVTATLTREDGSQLLKNLTVNDQRFTPWAIGERVVTARFDGPFDAYLTLDNIAVLSPVPEPGTTALWLAGLAATAGAARRRSA